MVKKTVKKATATKAAAKKSAVKKPVSKKVKNTLRKKYGNKTLILDNCISFPNHRACNTVDNPPKRSVACAKTKLVLER